MKMVVRDSKADQFVKRTIGDETNHQEEVASGPVRTVRILRCDRILCPTLVNGWR
ncbi:hypothetical protein BofuT4_P013820.1 [Botrytis cinerea T4]|uniref:Uncharacterized protein n=1 Tax=Botryotinia fuckeliana (strain T4) TaxID=999810 RepID=G2XMZ8_BOTF4|nr:hypothetical protein BofuT4_P013820.1 [Botrytis cinerea T4]